MNGLEDDEKTPETCASKRIVVDIVVEVLEDHLVVIAPHVVILEIDIDEETIQEIGIEDVMILGTDIVVETILGIAVVVEEMIPEIVEEMTREIVDETETILVNAQEIVDETETILVNAQEIVDAIVQSEVKALPSVKKVLNEWKFRQNEEVFLLKETKNKKIKLQVKNKMLFKIKVHRIKIN